MRRAICTRLGGCTCPAGVACDHAVTLPQHDADELTVREILADLEREIGADLECAQTANEVKR